MSGASVVRVGRYVVPLADRTVVRHFVGRHLVAHDLRGRFCGWLARGSVALGLMPLARQALDLGYGPRRALPPWSGPVRDAIEEILVELGIPDENLRIHLLDPEAGGRGTPGGLVFGFDGRNGAAPAVVLKVRLRKGGRPGLAREWRALHDLRDRLPPPLRSGVPEPLARRVAGSAEIVAMAGLPGRPAYLELHNRLAPAGRAPHHLRAAISWLAELHRATAVHGGPAEDGSGLPAPEELAARAEPCGGGATRDGGLPWVRELREELASTPLGRTASHGDYWARNLLLDGERVRAVVDWEHYRPSALPTTDLFHLFISYGLALRWTRFRPTPALDGFRRTFVEENRVSRAVRSALELYTEARGLPLPRLRRLFLLHLLTQGAPEGAGGGSPAPNPFGTAEAWRSAYHILRGSSRSVFTP